jgi:DNA-binding response OmpR family regulator
MSEQDIEQTWMNGANIYITKPNSFDELQRALKKNQGVIAITSQSRRKNEISPENIVNQTLSSNWIIPSGCTFNRGSA